MFWKEKKRDINDKPDRLFLIISNLYEENHIYIHATNIYSSSEGLVVCLGDQQVMGFNNGSWDALIECYPDTREPLHPEVANGLYALNKLNFEH